MSIDSIKAWFKDFFTLPVVADEPERDIKFPRGTIITCPSCKCVLGESLEDIHKGETARAAAWDSDFIKPGEPMLCECGTSYVRHAPTGAQLHTTKGWVG